MIPIIIALILSVLSSVLSIVGPNKLSDLTDEISKGIGINTKNMELITNDILEKQKGESSDVNPKQETSKKTKNQGRTK